MNERMTKATKQMKKCNNECKCINTTPSSHYITRNISRLLSNTIPCLFFIVAATRKSVRELENYKEIDKFNSMQFERDLM